MTTRRPPLFAVGVMLATALQGCQVKAPTPSPSIVVEVAPSTTSAAHAATTEPSTLAAQLERALQTPVTVRYTWRPRSGAPRLDGASRRDTVVYLNLAFPTRRFAFGDRADQARFTSEVLRVTRAQVGGAADTLGLTIALEMAMRTAPGAPADQIRSMTDEESWAPGQWPERGGAAAPLPNPAAGPTATQRTLYRERIRFPIAGAWREIAAQAGDTISLVALHIPSAVIDRGPDRANIVVVARRLPVDVPFSATVYSLTGPPQGDSTADVASGEWAADSTMAQVQWSALQGVTRYVIWDRIVQRAGVLVFIRVAMPRSDAPYAWKQQVVTDVNALVRGLTVDGMPVFTGRWGTLMVPPLRSPGE